MSNNIIKRYVFVGQNNERLSLEAESKNEAISTLMKLASNISYWKEMRVRKRHKKMKNPNKAKG
tara:strand:+ start:436 stop:627 length:192 start_codon:yes stop_codon:yes gene_type:complete